ncbi:nucleoside monophosphate kinase [Patescibacteria group bacterium AH-259-L05]|nr:nucleoside monophosphate kinase [Patescibacteria group bacterium AH-259-L05]
MSKKIFNLILLGPAGSGKGTQADLLVKKYNLQKIEAGELVRAKAKEDSELGREVHEIHKSGRHLPDDIMLALMREAFQNIEPDKGILVDGYPRTLGQAKDLDKIMNSLKIAEKRIAILIKVSDEEALRRLLNRSVCRQCKTVLIGRDKKICPRCGGEVVVRDYDTDETAVRKRLQWFHEKVMPAIEFYQQRKMLIRVNGEQSIENVFEETVQKLGQKIR